ncbi:type VII secretion target [Micromonospora sp. CPCC 205558]|uniref:type VII secretion target n=1 Tax=Micromonospora sp. CPCC 205558 TaxID=3122403 RepID=UPI002FEEA267
MAPESLSVDTDQIRAHARNIDTLRARFDAVKGASAFIVGDEQAYGLLCGWIAGVLDGRHTRQDELIAYVEENLVLVAAQLRKTADSYDAAETDTTGMLGVIGRRLQ